MSEQLIQQKIFRAIGGRSDVRLFRNNTGVAYQGQATTITQPVAVKLQPGDVVIRKARRVRFGLHVGSSDLIGWKSVKITTAMVGQVFARFLALEIKTPTGRTTDDQRNFIDVVNQHGGTAAVVRSELGAVNMIGGNNGVE